MDFRKATDELFASLAHEDLAKALGVSVATIRQARLGAHAGAHRAPPAKWESAVLELAKRRIDHLQRLVRELSFRENRSAMGNN